MVVPYFLPNWIARAMAFHRPHRDALDRSGIAVGPTMAAPGGWAEMGRRSHLSVFIRFSFDFHSILRRPDPM